MTSVASPTFLHLLPTPPTAQSPISGHYRLISIYLPHTLRHVLPQSLDPESSLYPSRYPTVEPRQLHLPRLYVLGFLQQIRGTTSSPIHSEKRDHRLKATSPERRGCENLVGTIRQTRKEHCRSRRDYSIPWFSSPPLLGFMLSLTDTISPNHGQEAIPVHTARQMCGETFISLVM